MDRSMVICLITVGAGFALLLILAAVLSVKQGQALRQLEQDHGWLWTKADHRRCAERAAFVQARDDPMAVKYRYRAGSVVSGTLDGVSFDLCTKMRIREHLLNSTPCRTWTACLVELLLLAQGADVKASSDLGWTPLHKVADGGSGKTSELLLAHGAEAAARDYRGRPPGVAMDKGHPEVADLIQSHATSE